MPARSTSSRTVTPLVIALALLGARPAAAQMVRDANCDGRVDEADRDVLVEQLFAAAPPSCAGGDVNRDGARSAADLVAFALGPRIVYIGIASPDGRPGTPLGVLPDGAPVFFRNSGLGFLLVVEVAAPPSGAPIGTTVFNSAAGDASRRPDFQIIVDHRLGDGSRAVCDEFGVPAVDPPDFALTQAISDTINDLACRFEVATVRNATCTQDAFGQAGFVSRDARAQFCLAVTGGMAFPSGETRVTVQVRDLSGLLGPAAQLVLQVQNGPIPPTFTPLPPTATRTATETPSGTPTASATSTHSPTRTVTATPMATRTATPTRTATVTPIPTATPSPRATVTATASATRSSTGTASATPSRTATGAATATRTRTGVATPTRSATGTATRTGTRTPTRPTPTQTRTATSAGTATRTGTRTRTPPATNTAGPTGTPTRTRTLSPTPTATVAASGPIITFFGLTRADDMLLAPSGMSNGIPVFEPLFGAGFSIVVEAKPGASRAPVGSSTFNAFGAPALRIQADHALGDGSALVCDDMPPLLGGVPAINPPVLGDDPATYDRLNDLGCRFIDGQGNKLSRPCGDSSCVLGADGEFACVTSDARVQFCGFFSQAIGLPLGDTLFTVRVADVQGNLGPVEQLIVRVQ